MTVMLGDIRLDRIEESSDIGNVARPGLPDAPAPCLEWREPDAIDPGVVAATRRRILEGGVAMGEEHHR